jgi:hypothetical protein
MFLPSKIVQAGIVFTLLATQILGQGFPQSAPGSAFNKEEVAAFVIKNEIKKMQETLRDKGYYRGKVDGIFGLRTRASVRAYQKAENLPITGQVDARTADRLGVRPESTWENFKRAGLEFGRGGDSAGFEVKRDKPSAGVSRVGGKASKASRKESSKATAIADNRR